MVALANVSIVDLLEVDPRPSFVVCLSPDQPFVAYINPALDGNATLLDLVHSPKQKHANLWQWITGASNPPSFAYVDVYWTRSAIGQEAVIIGANQQLPRPEPQRSPNRHELYVLGKSTESTCTSSRPTSPTAPLAPPPLGQRAKCTPDAALTPNRLAEKEARSTGPEGFWSLKRSTMDPGWILPNVLPSQRSFLEVIHTVDWDKTPLGPMSRWSTPLQRTFNQILTDSHPVAIYWGHTYTTLYNEAFSKLCGAKHPDLLGKSVEDSWPEAGTELKNRMKRIAREKITSHEGEWRFFVEKESDIQGAPNWYEETYLKWTVISISENNQCLGFVHSLLETTSVRLWERRMKMLVELGDELQTARDVNSYWQKTLQELGKVDPSYDVPMAILYSVQDDHNDLGSSAPPYGCRKRCRLEGTLGVPDGHVLTPPIMYLKTDSGALAAMFRQALARGPTTQKQPLLVQTKDGSLPGPLLQGIQWRGFRIPCRAAVICPIMPTKEEDVRGMLLLGLNPMRPYDNDYIKYMMLLNQKLASNLASTVLLEEEARRGRSAAESAAFDQKMLQEQLAQQTSRAAEVNERFNAFAEFLPLGMSLSDRDGNILFANDAWYKITGFPDNEETDRTALLSCVKEEDKAGIVRAFEEMHHVGHVTFEFRVKSRGQPGITPPITLGSPSFEKASLDLGAMKEISERHVLASAKAEPGPGGNTNRILTCLTDVTLHKRTAEEAVRRAQQAENLKRMAELATVGMYDMDLEGRLFGANTVFFEILGLEVVDLSKVDVRPWEQCLHQDDYPTYRETLKNMIREDKVQSIEVRLKAEWTTEDGDGQKTATPRCLQVTLMPVRTSEGAIKSFTGCLIDISQQKWQLDREKQRREEAIESKRQQENFSDELSHEIRNPLGAIIHCSDSIIASLTRVMDVMTKLDEKPTCSNGEVRSKEQSRESRQLVESSIENAETIISCAQHQKHIVDDVLTMSKLDSKLLAITPITAQPLEMVQEALKMFEVEARRIDISLTLEVDKSFEDVDINYLDFDPSRVKQVLINLLTNALKFTKTSGQIRNVSVDLSASLTRPTDCTSGVEFLPGLEDGKAEYLKEDDSGDEVYLLFKVKDTGQGLNEKEKKSLFKRFSQASRRTHVKYGGSGLGLFISRRLTELQGGAIGVASQPGVGSTFSFYIKGHRSSQTSIQEAEAAAKATRAALLVMGGGYARGSRANGSGNTTPTSSSSAGRKRFRAEARGAGAPVLDPSLEIRGVMVVEDNLINQHITKRHLTEMGYNVVVANHGLEAIEILKTTDRAVENSTCADETKSPKAAQDPVAAREETPQLASSDEVDKTPKRKSRNMPSPISNPFPLSVILLDIEMPVMDGKTCARKIRELEREGRLVGGRIPIVAVSANARMEQIMEAKAAGCDDVLVKPYRMPELIDKMRLVMSLLATGGPVGSDKGSRVGNEALNSTGLERAGLMTNK